LRGARHSGVAGEIGRGRCTKVACHRASALARENAGSPENRGHILFPFVQQCLSQQRRFALGRLVDLCLLKSARGCTRQSLGMIGWLVNFSTHLFITSCRENRRSRRPDRCVRRHRGVSTTTRIHLVCRRSIEDVVGFETQGCLEMLGGEFELVVSSWFSSTGGGVAGR
jgi:hypothetical protein